VRSSSQAPTKLSENSSINAGATYFTIEKYSLSGCRRHGGEPRLSRLLAMPGSKYRKTYASNLALHIA